MKKETREALREITRAVLSVPITLRWPSNYPLPGGERLTKKKGEGIDYVSTDDYQPGDNPRHIDWLAVAASDDDFALFTRRFIEAKPVPVCVLVQAGKLMLFGTDVQDKRTLSTRLAGSIIRSAGTTDDKVQGGIFSKHQVEVQFAPTTATSLFDRALGTILEASERETPVFRKQNSGLVQLLRTLPATKSLVFILGDFINLSEEEKKALKRAGAIHDVVCVVLTDPREMRLPEGWGPCTLDDIETGRRKTIWLTNKVRKQFAANAQKRLADLREFFHKAHCSSAVFSTDQDAKETIKAMMQMFAGHRSRG
jgi:uncharacterized protein (DUF58 family)